MSVRTTCQLTCFFVLVLCLSGVVSANQEEGKGFAIAARSDRSDNGFGDSSVRLTMVLRNAAGEESLRSLSLSTKEKENEDVGDKTLVLFETPKDIEGTALLSYAKILAPDDQWLYLPALKRVKRISSSNKSGPFVGSEFSFEDLTAAELNKYEYSYLTSEGCGDLQCDVLERIPRYINSGYAKQVAWVDQRDYQIRKIEFYDRRGSLLKVLVFEDFRRYDNGVWRSHHMVMKNVQTQKETELIYDAYQFNTGLTEKDFVKGRLARLR